MKIKQLFKYSGLVLATVLFVSIYFYFKFKEKDYDSLIHRAYKAKIQFSEFMFFDGEFEPAIPDKENNSKDYVGIDIESNGIRDDIDIWINRIAKSYNERQGMRQYARAYQLLQRNCQQNSLPHSQEAIANLRRARLCLKMISEIERGGESFGLDMLNIIIPNTRARKSCYVLDESKKSAKAITSIELLKANCNFVVRNPEIIVEVYKILESKK